MIWSLQEYNIWGWFYKNRLYRYSKIPQFPIPPYMPCVCLPLLLGPDTLGYVLGMWRPPPKQAHWFYNVSMNRTKNKHLNTSHYATNLLDNRDIKGIPDCSLVLVLKVCRLLMVSNIRMTIQNIFPMTCNTALNKKKVLFNPKSYYF